MWWFASLPKCQASIPLGMPRMTNCLLPWQLLKCKNLCQKSFLTSKYEKMTYYKYTSSRNLNVYQTNGLRLQSNAQIISLAMPSYMWEKTNRRELRFFGVCWEARKPRWFLRKVMACSGRAPRCPLKSPPLATMPLISKHRQVSELISMACPDLFWGWHASLPPLKHLYKHMEIPLYI